MHIGYVLLYLKELMHTAAAPICGSITYKIYI